MRELKNVITIKGQLVKNGIEEFATKKGEDAIGGSLVVRTADGSEHDCRVFAYKYKKDENGNFTSEESYFYKQYIAAMENLRDLEHCPSGELPDVISITDGAFSANDFKGRDGNVVSTNNINMRFINKVEPKDYDSTVMDAKFELEGIIEKLEDEVKNNEPTGDLIVRFMVISQRADGFGRDANYTPDHLIPVKLVVDKEMVEPFRNAGYYEGCFTKFTGKVVNKAEKTEIREKASFGPDIVKQVTTNIRKNEIVSGSAVASVYEVDGLSQEIVDALISKRKATVNEVKNGNGSGATENKGFTAVPKMAYNPFNPFAQN